MKFKYSILNVPATLFIIGCLIYTAINYKKLSYEEGWGVVNMIGLCGLGLLLLIVDLIIQNVFKKNRAVLITIEVIVLIVAVASLFIKI
ncbi:MAG: hypothetical protein JST70_05445 [Bacteroidetes bacterium]|nr:hypothetical protein [Bacteroidota bacterium]